MVALMAQRSVDNLVFLKAGGSAASKVKLMAGEKVASMAQQTVVVMVQVKAVALVA